MVAAVVELVTDAERFRALEPEWRDLWQRSRATPFQSPMWLVPWWQTYGTGELHTIAVRDNNRLATLAPLFVVRDDDESLGMLAGTGNSDYTDILGAAEPVMEAIAEIDCQMWDLQQLRSSSPLLSARAPQGWSDAISEHDRCPVLKIENAGEDLANLISTHFRKKLRYYRRALSRAGEVTVETCDATNIDQFLAALFELHAARWQRRGLPGVLAAEVDQQFHRAATRALLDAGALRMYATRISGRIVAVFYGMSNGETVYYYLSGYDPELEKLSIGTLIVAHAIEQAVHDGAREFDFLRGAEDYKYTWGAVDRINQRRQLFRG